MFEQAKDKSGEWPGTVGICPECFEETLLTCMTAAHTKDLAGK